MSVEVKVVEGLCAEHQINLIKAPDRENIGERVDLCEPDRETPAKQLDCDCVVLKDYGRVSGQGCH